MVVSEGELEVKISDEGGNDGGMSVLENMPSFEKKDEKRKTFQEKAREKNYYQDEEGNWWMKEEEEGWGDERVDSFKLDEEYPDLADRIEKLAKEYNIELHDRDYGLKKLIYDNAKKLDTMSDAHLRNIFMVRAAISVSVGGTEKFLVNCEEKKLEKIVDLLDSFYEKVVEQFPDKKLPQEIGKVAELLAINYDDKLVEGDFVEQISRYAVMAGKNRGDYRIMSGISSGIEGLATNEDSGKMFGEYMDYYLRLSEDDEKITKYETKRNLFMRYVQNHGMKSDTIAGFENEIYPRLKQQDEEVEPIIEGGNAYGVGRGNFGIADYAEECFLSKCTPDRIDYLVRINHEIPTSDFAKFEQNRKDASRLQGSIIGGRDFIHDEQVGTHEVLKAIKDFYEHHDKEDSKEYRDRLEKLEEKYHFGVLPHAFDIEAYDKPIKYMSDYNKAKFGSPEERAIDILNRLVENTAPNILEVPVTKNDRLNKMMKDIDPIVDEKTGEVKVEIKDVAPAIIELNGFIQEHYGKQGVSPSMVSAVAYLDKMAAYALKNCSKKELPELLFDPNFKEIVKFSQLTSSTEYSDEGFEAEYNKLVRAASEAYGMDEAGEEEAKDALRSLSRWITTNASELGKKYSKKRTTERFSDAVWSGNLSDALINLFERID